MPSLLKTHKHLILVFGIALLLRAAFVLCMPQEPLIADAAGYDAIGWNLARGDGFSIEPGVPTPIRAPLYPFMLASVYSLAGHVPEAARLAQALLGALTCVLFLLTARALFGETVGLLTGLAAALYPVLIVYTGLILSETLFTFVFALSLLLFLGAMERGSLPLYGASGLALGLSALARPTTLIFPLAFFLTLFLAKARRRLAGAVLATLLFAAVIAPWTARNYREFGTFMPVAIGGSICLYCTGFEARGDGYQQGWAEVHKRWPRDPGAPGAAYIALDRALAKDGMRLVRENFGGYVRVVLTRSVRFWFSSHSSVFGVDRSIAEYAAAGAHHLIAVRLGLLAFHGLLLAAAVLGMLARARDWRTWALFALTLAYFHMHNLFDFCPRYAVPVLPYVMMFAAAALRRRDAQGTNA